MNLPNALTLGRIFLVPLLVVVLLTKFPGKELVGAAIFALASATDWLDGWLARRNQQVTTLGQLMDPLADKLLVSAALISLVQMGLAPAWMVAVILGREFAITVLRSMAHSRGVVIAASPLGKFKMVSEVVAILALILGRDHLQQFAVLGTIALWIALISAVASGMDYYVKYTRGQGSGFKVQGSGFKVQGSGFKVQGSGFGVQGSGFKGAEFDVQEPRLRAPAKNR